MAAAAPNGRRTSPHGPTTSFCGSAAAKVRITEPRVMATSRAPGRSARRSISPEPRSQSLSATAASTRPTTPTGVASTEVAEPKGTKANPNVTLEVSASGAASASPTTAAAAEDKAIRPHCTEPPQPPPTRTTASRSATPSTALIQKIQRQSATASTTAPSKGPITEPNSCTPPTIPSGRPRRSASQRSATMASVAGTSPPPPMPWMTRPPMRTGRSVASAVTALPMTKTIRQPRRTRWREVRSASRPMSGRTAT